MGTQALIASIFKNPPPQNIEWMDVLALFKERGIAYRKIDERIIVIAQTGRQSTVYVLQRGVGETCLGPSSVDDVRHLLLVNGISPET